MVEYLRTQPSSSIQGFTLSNILEWLSEEQTEEFFSEIHRTAAPGAKLVFRNFVGWTEVPEKWKSRFVEDKALGERLMPSDRAIVQLRIAVCDIRKTPADPVGP